MRCPNCNSTLIPLDQASTAANPYLAHACQECRCTVVMSSTTGPAWSFPFLKVLIVEDNFQNREVLQLMLEKLGCQVTFATDAEQGVGMAFRDRPDVIFMDLQLEGSHYDGLECIRILKANEQTKDITVFAYTAEPAPYKVIDAVDAGAADALLKPFKRSQLIDLLVRHFSAPVAKTQVGI